MNRTVLIVGAVIVVPLLVFLALAFQSDPRQIDSPLVGKTAPPFALTDLEGRLWQLEDLRGKPVVINFWATWCQPCMVEHPILIAGSRRYGDDVQFLGVIYQDRPAAIQRFLDRSGSWGPSLVDEGSQVAIAYGVYGAPETFFIDPDGVIVEKVVGIVTPEILAEHLGGML